ncbi:copper radical oxidase [Laccaria amethystina LaAM-08-1]|uniref:Copper radical oxidase n=1 Tax=Laccaria amethystina LaAM-08-1 TaxID=1095629 RepID=A0A0C9WM96_9AGAR|nr:copper radical oxidase [Laccaria amethystina LaAM-08-1]
MFLGSFNKVYITDRAEKNLGQLNGHPAWDEEWDLRSNDHRVMEIVTDSFCVIGVIKLLEFEAFKENTITTGWLDSLMSRNLPAEHPDATLAVVCGAVTKAHPASNACWTEYPWCNIW